MKKIILSSLLAIFAAGAIAQPQGGGGAGGGSLFRGDMVKIFGDNPNYSADIEIHSTGGPNGASITMPGKIEYHDGQSRFEMDMANLKGAAIPPEAVEQMKKMGMDKTIMISRPDKQMNYLIYPGINGYVEVPVKDQETLAPASDYKMEITKLGEETVDGHPCVKNKVVTTDKQGKTHESTVWNATDMHKFPVKLEMTEKSSDVSMTFKNVKMEKPAAAEFEPPASAKKYASMMEMMMSHAGGQ
jgi:hypothetical protein